VSLRECDRVPVECLQKDFTQILNATLLAPPAFPRALANVKHLSNSLPQEAEGANLSSWIQLWYCEGFSEKSKRPV